MYKKAHDLKFKTMLADQTKISRLGGALAKIKVLPESRSVMEMAEHAETSAKIACQALEQ